MSRSFLVRICLMLMLPFLLAGAPPRAAADLTVGNSAVGTNFYPFGVGSLRTEGSLLCDYGFNTVCGAFIDPAGGFAYFSIFGNGSVKIRLSDFKIVDHFASVSFYSAVVDPAGVYAYLASGGLIQKVRLADFQVVDSIALTESQYGAHTALIAPAGDYAYFATQDPTALIYKIRLSDFKKDGLLTTSSANPGLTIQDQGICSATIDPAGTYGYFGVWPTPKIYKVRLSDMTEVGILRFADGSPKFAAMAPAGNYAFFGRDSHPPCVSKVRLSDFQEDSSLTLAHCLDFMLLDPARNALYVAADATVLTRLRPADFSSENYLPVSGVTQTENIAVLDPIGGNIYFGDFSPPAAVVKVAVNTLKDIVRATKITLPESAAVSTLRIYSHQGGGRVQLALYGDGPTKPLLWRSQAVDNNTTAGWINVPIVSGTPSTLQLRAGTYWLAFNTDSPNAFASYAAGAPGDGFRCLQTYGSFPASFGPGSVQSTADRWSVDLAYTPVFIDTPPEAPVVTLSNLAPGTLDDITATAVSTDPDAAIGDSVVAYRYEWSLGGVVKSTSATLSAALTTKGQTWLCKVWAQDTYGQWSDPGQATVTIVNTPPTQPLVEIRPKPARTGEALVVDVQTYSTDPDGDTVAYDFQWFKSTDGGKTWTHKVELDGSSQVAGPYILDGDLWEVHYIPYEKIVAKPQKPAPGALAPTATARRIDGQYAWDRAYIGANNPPKLALDQPVVQRRAGGMVLTLGWNFSDADGDNCTLDLDWTDLKASGYQSIARGLPARQGSFSGPAALPQDRPVSIHGVIRDTKGAIAQQISAAVLFLPADPDVVLDYLLGKSTDPAGLDANLDHQVDIGDVLRGLDTAQPDTPSQPQPADGAQSVSRTPTLSWTGGHVQGYQEVYLWQPNAVRPTTALMATSPGITSYKVTTPLSAKTTYCWQVIAVNFNGTLKSTGPVWLFTTQP